MMGARIEWQPIAELPEELRDGREVLLWVGFGADVGVWLQQRLGSGAGWAEDDFDKYPIDGVTHFAEITPPA